MENPDRWVRRTRYIIYQGFQLRYIGVLVIAAAVAALIIGGILYVIVDMNWALQSAKGVVLFPEIEELWVRERNMMGLTFGGVFLFLATVLSCWGIFLSHRVAGPVFVLSRRMTKIVLEHDLVTPLFLRKKDALQEIKDVFNETLEVLRHQLREESNSFRAILEKLRSMDSKFPQFQEVFKQTMKQIEFLEKDKERWLILNHR